MPTAFTTFPRVQCCNNYEIHICTSKAENAPVRKAAMFLADISTCLTENNEVQRQSIDNHLLITGMKT